MKRYIFFALTVFWLLFIFYNSLKPAAESSLDSSTFVNLARNVLDFFNISIRSDILSYLIRKAAHIFEFFLLTIFFLNFISQLKIQYRYFVSFSFSGFMALIDEFLQNFSEGRASSVIDVFIDLIGAGLGIALCYLLALCKKNKSVLNKR